MSRLKLETSDVRSKVDILMSDLEQRIVGSPPGVCPIELQLAFLQFCHAQSCGKCAPCRIGLGQLVHLLTDVLENKATEETLKLIEKTAKDVQASADCAIGTEAARVIVEGLKGFEEEYLSHIDHHRCLEAFEQPIPCVQLCPAHVDIPGYLALVNEGRTSDAVKLIRKDNPFPTACALICEHPCEQRCRRSMVDTPLNIRGIKKYAVDTTAADTVAVPKRAADTGKTVAVIGGGPSGLTCAYFLALMGHKVVVYEEKAKLGGMLRYGIPSYRFPRERLDEDINAILSVGNIEVKYNTNIGTDIKMEDVYKQYDAVYVAIGAHTGKSLRIDNVNADGVDSAVNILREVGYDNLPDYTGKQVVVIGGGNVAMDCARTAMRCNAKSVTIVYRRRQVDMTALDSEIESAIAEGIELMTLQAPDSIEVDENGHVKGLRVRPQISGLYDSAGRPSPVDASKEPVSIPCEQIMIAVGQDIVSEPFEEFGMPAKRHTFIAGEDCKVEGFDGLYVGGDCQTGPATVIKAIAAGKVAAGNIDEYLGFHHEISCDVEIPNPTVRDKIKRGRINITERPAFIRKTDFLGVENPMSQEEAACESSRCLRCDHFGCATLRGGRELKW